MNDERRPRISRMSRIRRRRGGGCSRRRDYCEYTTQFRILARLCISRAQALSHGVASESSPRREPWEVTQWWGSPGRGDRNSRSLPIHGKRIAGRGPYLKKTSGQAATEAGTLASARTGVSPGDRRVQESLRMDTYEWLERNHQRPSVFPRHEAAVHGNSGLWRDRRENQAGANPIGSGLTRPADFRHFDVRDV